MKGLIINNLNNKTMLKHYETVFIMTPVLSDEQAKETVSKYKKLLTDSGCKIVNEKAWGLRKLQYPIQKKTTGFYHLFEFQAPPAFIAELEVAYKRDERLLRFLTVALDKHAVAYNERSRNKVKTAVTA
jgi:small subunit ribosomal protein S6